MVPSRRSPSPPPPPPRSPAEPFYSLEQLRRTMTIMLNVFSLNPVDVYHPGRHMAVRDAIPVLSYLIESKLDESYGLTTGQIEGLNRLLRNWDQIVNDAVNANTIIRRAMAELSSGDEIGRSIQMLESKKQFLEAERDKLKNEEYQGIWARGTYLKSEHAEQHIEEEWIKTVDQIDELERRGSDLARVEPVIKQQVQEAEAALEKGVQEWQDFKILLGEINSLLFG